MNNEEKILEMLADLKADVSSLKSDISSLRVTQREQSALLKEVDERSTRTETLLKEVDERSTRTAVLMELDVMKKINVLYEGHSDIINRMSQLAQRSRLDAMEDDMELIKSAMRIMRQDIADLKKAQ